MHRCQCNSGGAGRSQCATTTDLLGLVTWMGCACAEGLTAADAPLARELFNRVEAEGQCLAEAARKVGIAPGDGAYLLAGLRRDVAAEMVAVLLSATAAVTPRSPEEARGDPGIDQPIYPKGETQ